MLRSKSCLKCCKSVFQAEEVLAAGGIWHTSCFTCGGVSEWGCRRVLNRGQFLQCGQIPFCGGCFNKYSKDKDFNIATQQLHATSKPANFDEIQTGEHALNRSESDAVSIPDIPSEDIRDEIIEKSSTEIECGGSADVAAADGEPEVAVEPADATKEFAPTAADFAKLRLTTKSVSWSDIKGNGELWTSDGDNERDTEISSNCSEDGEMMRRDPFRNERRPSDFPMPSISVPEIFDGMFMSSGKSLRSKLGMQVAPLDGGNSNGNNKAFPLPIPHRAPSVYARSEHPAQVDSPSSGIRVVSNNSHKGAQSFYPLPPKPPSDEPAAQKGTPENTKRSKLSSWASGLLKIVKA